MKINKLAVRFMGFILCAFFILINSFICSAAPTGYTEYKVEGHSISLPDNLYVMYEGKEDLEEITVSEEGNSVVEDTAASGQEAEEPENTDAINQESGNIVTDKDKVELPLGTFIILLFVLLFLGVKGKKKKEFHEDAFSLSVTKGLQGFCAVGIMLHHLAQTVTQNNKLDKGMLNIMCDIGVFFVGVFFFCSGYGVYTSLKTKPNYLKGFLRKRLSAILVPFYTGNTIFVLTAVLFGETFTKTELINALTGWVLLNTQLWFIVEIFILYIIFYILFKALKDEKIAYIFMGVFILALMVTSLLLGHDLQTKSGGAWLKGEWWYNGIFIFFIGMTFSRYYNALIANIKKFYWIWLSAGLIGSGVFYALTQYMLKTKGYWAEWNGHPGYLEKIQTLACQLPMIIFMVITFFLVSMKFQFKNTLLSFLGKIAIELYIIHNLFIVYLRNHIEIKNDFIYILSVYVLSISMAVLLHAFDEKVIALILCKKTGGGSGGSIKEQNKTKLKSQREYFIDCMRLLMAFFVVFIHAPFGGKAGEIFFCFGKMAVPFFIVVSGYFCFSDKTEIFEKRIKKQAERIFLLCVGANFLYAYLYLIGNKLGVISEGIHLRVNDASLKDLFLYNQSPVADHLWFLGSLFYAFVLMLVLIKLKIYKYILHFAPVFLGIYLYLFYNGEGKFIQYRNVLIVTLPYFMMGCLIHWYKQKIREKIKPGILMSAAAAFSVFVVFEYLLRKNADVPYLSIEVLVYLVVLICLYYSHIGSKGVVWWLGSKCTLSIYILHMGVLWYFWFVHASFSKAYPAAVTVAAFMLPLLISAFIKIIKNNAFKQNRRIT